MKTDADKAADESRLFELWRAERQQALHSL